MITNKNKTTLYTGITNNLIRRIYEHRQKLVPGFSSRYNLEILVYYELFQDPQTAISREKTLKNMVRRKKEALIQNVNPEWNDLYREIV